MTAQDIARSHEAGGLSPQDKRNIFVFIVVSAAFLILYQIPYGRYVIYPISLLFTYVHEMGHGLTAILVGGSFEHFKMWSDTSGVAYNMIPDASFARALVAAGGLINPAIVAALLFLCGRYERAAKATLGVFGALAAISCILLVRNLFGVLFVSLLAAFCLFSAINFSPKVVQTIIIILAIGLATSTIAEGDYLFMDFGTTGDGKEMASDTQQIAQNLFLPYWFWGGLVAALSGLVLVLGIWFFFKKGKKHEPQKA